MTTSQVTPIVIEVGGSALDAELNDSATAQALIQELPLDAQASVWGEEIYFATSVEMAEGPDAVEEVPVGTLAYWPPGRAFCIFFGPTPVSRGTIPRAYSPVNVIGRVRGDVGVLRRVHNRATIRVKAQS
jgi:uncharacterized protein